MSRSQKDFAQAWRKLTAEGEFEPSKTKGNFIPIDIRKDVTDYWRNYRMGTPPARGSNQASGADGESGASWDQGNKRINGGFGYFR